MKVFWRNDPLSEVEMKLLNLILESHRKSVFRENISTVVLKSVFEGSWSFQSAVAAAIMSFGGAHGPVENVMELLASEHPDTVAKEHLDLGIKVPGWGSSFEDTIWISASEMICEYWTPMFRKILKVTEILHSADKNIKPNPACWTAASNLILGIPRHLALWPVLQGRMSGWAEVLV